MYCKIQISNGYKVGITMTGGWSSYLDNGKSSKLHYFYNDEGKSTCGMVTVSDRKLKHKFISDDIESYNENKICKICVFRKGNEWVND